MIGTPVPQNRWDLVPSRSGRSTVSIIVPHYDQQADLDRLLAAIALQRNVMIDDIVVVDDGSPTIPTVPPQVNGVPVTLLVQADRGIRPAAARNLGVGVSSGEVLVFFDADTLPGPDTVARLARLPHDSDESVTVGRRFHVDLDRWTPDDVSEWLRRDSSSPDRAPRPFTDPRWLQELYTSTADLSTGGPRVYQGIIGAAMAIRRSFFDEIGGFDDAIDCYGGEDWDLAHRAWIAGGLLAHVGDAHVFHNGPDWAERTGGNGVKNDERIVLQQRIPSLDDPIRTAIPSAVVQLHNRTWAWEDTIVCVASVLEEFGPTVDVVLEDDRPEVRAATSFDPRVTSSCAERLDRCLANLEILRPIVIEPDGLVSLVRRVIAETDGGQVWVEADSGPLLVATATRARARARRWSGRLGRPTEQLLADLFGVDHVDAKHAGIDELRDRVDLSTVLRR